MPVKATRAAFGEAILELGARNPRIVVINADLGKSTMTQKFAEIYPDRTFNVGIAEANLIGIGAGLALSGWIPFICTFACFVIGRFETIRLSISYSHANVKIVGTHAGLGIGEDGYSQMGMEDLTLARALPNLAIIQPADEAETRQAVAYAAEHDGPVYLRLTRQLMEPVSPPGYTFRFGKGTVLREGTDVTILGTGGPVFNCLKAADLLAEEGIRAEVINIATLKPLDEELILRSAGKTGHVVTVEDHTVRGGLGGAVAELLAEILPTPLRRLGIQGFGESGDPKALYARHGLDPQSIAGSVRKRLNR
jgi:transketolase